MASALVVPVVEIRNVRIHPNADMLSLCDVLGYQMVNGLVEDPNGELVRYFINGKRDDKGRRIPCDPSDCSFSDMYEGVRYSFRYKNGDLAVYFPADTILPQEWAEKFDVTHLLQSGNKIGRCRLRGEPSFGLVVELPDGVDWKIGDNVAEYYGATKFTPPPRNDPGDCAPYDDNLDPYFIKYTDIQNGKLFYENFRDGEEVIGCEKIHGGNSRVGIVNGTLVAGSRTTRKSRPPAGESLKNYLYWCPLANSGVEQLLRQFERDGAKTVILFGEVYGQGVQSLHYGVGGQKEKGYRAFDLYVDGKYLNYEDFKKACDEHGVESAPVLYRGQFDLAKINELSDGQSSLPGAQNIREGIVVRPLVERNSPKLGRMILKFIGSNYELSNHKNKDTTDV